MLLNISANIGLTHKSEFIKMNDRLIIVVLSSIVAITFGANFLNSASNTEDNSIVEASNKANLNEEEMPDLRDPEEIARDLFLEGKRVEYERRLDRPISDAEFQVLYEQDYKQEQQAQQRKRSAEYAYRQANPTGVELASRRSFCGDDAICMRTGIK